MKKYLFLCLALAAFISCEKDDNKDDELPATVTDIDGNVYETVKIGNQLWMAENLRVTHYRNGSDIPNITENAAWTGLTTGARCYYDNDSATYDTAYGVLYNGYAIADSRNIAPEGWHVATKEDWNELQTALGGSVAIGGKLKEEGTMHWISPNTGATNESDFGALPGGLRNEAGAFSNLTSSGYWWAPDEVAGENLGIRSLYCNELNIFTYNFGKKLAFSVRCVKD